MWKLITITFLLFCISGCVCEKPVKTRFFMQETQCRDDKHPTTRPIGKMYSVTIWKEYEYKNGFKMRYPVCEIYGGEE